VQERIDLDIATQRMTGIIRSMLKGLIGVPFCKNRMNSNAKCASW